MARAFPLRFENGTRFGWHGPCGTSSRSDESKKNNATLMNANKAERFVAALPSNEKAIGVYLRASAVPIVWPWGGDVRSSRRHFGPT
jgi:hypothetical protein